MVSKFTYVFSMVFLCKTRDYVGYVYAEFVGQHVFQKLLYIFLVYLEAFLFLVGLIMKGGYYYLCVLVL